MTIVGLLRHGETCGPRGFCGTTDTLLTPQGYRDMRNAVDNCRPHATQPHWGHWDIVISSPQQRCSAFAHDYACRHSMHDIIEDDRLCEIHFGQWEGYSAADIRQLYPQELSRYWRDPLRFTPPGGEPLREFHLRVTRAWRDIVEQHEGKNVLVVTHGGVIRVLTCMLQNRPLTDLLCIDVDYASLHVHTAHSNSIVNNVPCSS
jgi:alpha-ribazole phosphatase